jgi:hypothetical protein
MCSRVEVMQWTVAAVHEMNPSIHDINAFIQWRGTPVHLWVTVSG